MKRLHTFSSMSQFALTISILMQMAEYHCQANGDPTERKAKKIDEIKRTIRIIDGRQLIVRTNATLHIETPATDLVVAMGAPVLDCLFVIMKDNTTDFDTFARCYSTANQILSRIDPSNHVPWRPGTTLKQLDGFLRVLPPQEDESGFRSDIVSELEKQTDLVRKKIGSKKK